MTRIRSNVEIRPRTTTPRATPAPTSDRFREALGRSATQLVAGVEQIASLVPGGPVLTAALRGGGSAGGVSGTHAALTSTDGASTTGTSTTADADPTSGVSFADDSSQAMQLLELQHSLAMEQQRIQTISNVMKARHDSNKAVIGNLR